jgi:hypothetical protein
MKNLAGTTKRKLLIVLAVVALIGMWAGGTFDRALVNVGLNSQECAHNGFGATFCGKELDEYRARIGRVKQESAQAGEAARRQVEEAANTAKRQAEEVQP